MVLYIGTILGIGYIASRRVKDADDFATARGSYCWRWPSHLPPPAERPFSVYPVWRIPMACRYCGSHFSTKTATADQVFWYQPAGLDWDLRELVRESPVSMQLCSDVAQMVQTVVARVRPGDHVVIMSNGDFDGAHRQMIEELAGTGPSKA